MAITKLNLVNENITALSITATESIVANTVHGTPAGDVALQINDRLQVANAVATYATISTVGSNLANTNAYIATKAPLASPTFTGNVTAAADSNAVVQNVILENADSNYSIGVGLKLSLPNVGLGGQYAFINYVNDGSTLGYELNLGHNGTAGLTIDQDNDVYMGSSLAWHAGNDGSGSGLDADLLDGQQGSYYLDYNNFSNTPTIPTNNNQLTNGAGYTSTTGPFYHYSSLGSFAPGTSQTARFGRSSAQYMTFHGSSAGNVLTSVSSTSNPKSNMYFAISQDDGSTSGQVFTLNGSSGTIWHTGNDGSGSGLDADLLDGQQGSYYLNYNNLSNKPTLGGGTPYLDLATGNYGTVKVDDDRGVTWAGYAIRDDWVLMSDGASNVGIYNDTDDEWALLARQNAEIELYHNGVLKMETTSAGVSVSGSLTASGDVTAYSDERLKSDVQTLDGSKVYEMRGVSFTRDGEAGSGVIAQELQKVAPELVHDSGEYLSVAYGNLVGYLIEAVKQQQSQIELQQQEINQLKEKIQ